MLICRLDVMTCLCLSSSFAWGHMSDSLLCVDRSLVTLRALQLSTPDCGVGNENLDEDQTRPWIATPSRPNERIFYRPKTVATACMYPFEGSITFVVVDDDHGLIYSGEGSYIHMCTVHVDTDLTTTLSQDLNIND